MKCYDSSDDKFLCALRKIKCVYSDQVYNKYLEKRYGIKSCKRKIDVSILNELTEYIMTTNLSEFDENTYRNEIINNDVIQERVKSGYAPEFYMETLNICNISVLMEKINSL